MFGTAESVAAKLATTRCLSGVNDRMTDVYEVSRSDRWTEHACLQNLLSKLTSRYEYIYNQDVNLSDLISASR